MNVFKKLLLLCVLAPLACFAFQERFIESGDAELFCKVGGKGEPLIVLHGGPGMSHDYLLPYMKRLEKNNFVIFFDQRGCGKSTGEINAETINIATYLEDIEAIRKEFGFEKVSVLGHSWGGLLAMEYAIAYPQSIDKLILLDSMPKSCEDTVLFVNEYVTRMAPYANEMEAIKLSRIPRWRSRND